MVKLLLIVNTPLTLFFGIAALAAPVKIFELFGLELAQGAHSLLGGMRQH
jgi:hypothetical protein